MNNWHDTLGTTQTIESLFRLFDQPRHMPIRTSERSWLNTLNLRHIDTPVGRGNYYEIGPKTSPVVLLIHGWGGHAGMFAPLANFLISLDYRIIIPDLLGHGYSSHNIELHLGAQLTWLKHLLAELCPCQHVIAHSLGGVLATLLYATVETPFRSAIFLGTPQSLTHAFQYFIEQNGLNESQYISKKLSNWYSGKHELPIFCMENHCSAFTKHALFIHGGKDHRFNSSHAHANYQTCPLPSTKKNSSFMIT